MTTPRTMPGSSAARRGDHVLVDEVDAVDGDGDPVPPMVLSLITSRPGYPYPCAY